MAQFSSKNIFINCPYDKQYAALWPIVFTVSFLGFNPRLALESTDSGTMRIDRILKLIRESQYAIHDLSRLRACRRGERFRLNMPFELGLDYGCRIFGKAEFKQKKLLVLEKDKHSVKGALSDLSNSDVCSHNGEPAVAVLHVRNWLVNETGASGPSGTAIWYEYNDFMGDLYKKLRRNGFGKVDIDSLPLPELLGHMKKWFKTKGKTCSMYSHKN